MPQFLNQEPEGAQQLSLPDFFKVPHLAHAMAVAIIEVVAGAVAIHVAVDMVVVYWWRSMVLDVVKDENVKMPR